MWAIYTSLMGFLNNEKTVCMCVLSIIYHFHNYVLLNLINDLKVRYYLYIMKIYKLQK